MNTNKDTTMNTQTTLEKLKLAAHIIENSLPWEYQHVAKTDDWCDGGPKYDEVAIFACDPNWLIRLAQPPAPNCTPPQGYEFASREDLAFLPPETLWFVVGALNGTWTPIPKNMVGTDASEDTTFNYAVPVQPAQPPAPEVAHGIASAYLDAEGWCLFDAEGNLVEPWPKGWEDKLITAQFLRANNIYIANSRPDDADKPAFDLAAHVQANGFRALVDDEQWMNADEWTAEMLPFGTRPALVGEAQVAGDEWQEGKNQWAVADGSYTAPAENGFLCRRTRRPLPDLPASTQGKSLGQVAYEAFHEKGEGEQDHWKASMTQRHWEDAAQAVAAEVSRLHSEEVERLKNENVQAYCDIADALSWTRMFPKPKYHAEALPRAVGALIEEVRSQKGKQRECVEMEKRAITRAESAEKRVEELEELNACLIKDVETHSRNSLHWQNKYDGALTRISELERELTNIKSEMELCEKCKVPTPMELVHAGTCYKCIAEQAIDQNTLRPISEAGDVPEGCVRVYGYRGAVSKRWIFSHETCGQQTHCADIRLPTDHLVDVNKMIEEDNIHHWTAEEFAANQKEFAWIEHDGGKCPLRDDEVEEWEWQLVGGNCSGVRHVHKNPPSGLSWRNDLGHSKIARYRVKKWKPGYTATTITGPDGKVYTRHKPGDPMPCDPEQVVAVLFSDKTTDKKAYPGNAWVWSNSNSNADIIAWRYANAEPKAETVLQDKPELFNESKWIWMMEWCRKQGFAPANHSFWTEAEKQWNNRKQN